MKNRKVLPCAAFLLAGALVLGLAVWQDGAKNRLSNEPIPYLYDTDREAWLGMTRDMRESSSHVTLEQAQGLTTPALIKTLGNHPFVWKESIFSDAWYDPYRYLEPLVR